MSATPPKRRRDDSPFAGLIRCIAILSAVLVIGTLGFKFFEPEWSLWKALYFTTITITTVGYGDEGLQPAGQPFAVVLVLFGIGAATYSFSEIVQFAVDHPFDWKRAMSHHIAKMSGHIIVCGYGRMGNAVCERIVADFPVVVIEREGVKYDRAVEQGMFAISGSGTDDETLIEAGVERARGVLCCTDSDADNVFITLTVRRLNPKAFVACRADGQGSLAKMHDAGADFAVSPYAQAGIEVAHAIKHPALSRVLDEDFTTATV